MPREKRKREGDDVNPTETAVEELALVALEEGAIETSSSVLLVGAALAEALELNPNLTLAHHNIHGTQKLSMTKLTQIVLRISVTPAHGSTVEPELCTAPFTSARRAPKDLIPVLGVNRFDYILPTALMSLRTSGVEPITVQVPIACHLTDDPEAPLALRSMIFVPDVESDDGGGWLVTEERWEQRLRPVSGAVDLLTGPALGDALIAHPEHSLSEYNRSAGLRGGKVAQAVLRIAATPIAGAVVDTDAVTAPFTGLKYLASLGDVLGLTNVSKMLPKAIATARATGALPMTVNVPLACVGEPMGADALARPMFFIPDLNGAGSGWLITPERWDDTVKPIASATKIIFGASLVSALSRHPEFTLAEHNRNPALNITKAHKILMRTAVAPGPDGAIDPEMCTLPLTGTRRLEQYVAVLGLPRIDNQLQKALKNLREQGVSPIIAHVPIGISGDLPSDSPGVRAMQFIPDPFEEDGGSGWLVAPERWDKSLDLLTGADMGALEDDAEPEPDMEGTEAV